MKRRIAALVGFLGLLAGCASAGESAEGQQFHIGPWQLGMTREQVAAFTDHGPYLPVAITGGLETPNGIFQGKRTLTSFVFDGSGLLYIQVWNYEGKDFGSAKTAALEIFDLFDASFGGMEPGRLKISTNAPKGVDRGAMSAVMDEFFDKRHAAAEIARKSKSEMTLTMDMRPRMQPLGSRLFARFVYAGRFDAFYVFLFQDRIDLPPREDRSGLLFKRLPD
jgi:hypothetical protein